MGSIIIFKKFIPVLIFIISIIFFPGICYGQVNNEDCLSCHSDRELEAETSRGKKLNLFVPDDVLKGTVHEGLSCTDCHKGEKTFDEYPHNDGPMIKVCGECHEDIYDSFIKEDIHGKSSKAGNPRAPNCYDCHGGHSILPIDSAESRMSRKNQAETCGSCHGQEELNKEDGITARNLIKRFYSSVHYQAILEGKKGASCTDCHSHHNILSSASYNSTVSREGVSGVCSECHEEVVNIYLKGAHGRTLIHGNHDVPICTTCHGDHDMASLRDRSGDAKKWASTQVCIWCHGNERMMARYGLDTTPVESYLNDFHGLTQRGTMGESATCADCHNPHYSLPDEHPESRMYISNRGATCSECHGAVSENFALSFTHRKAMETPGSRIQNIVRIIYLLIIGLSISGMLFYNFLIWFHAIRRKFKSQRQQKHVQRMSRFERICHLTLILSFGMLVITGFALKFPEVFFARALFALGMDETIRALIHRLSGSIMTIDMIVFAFYLFKRRRGKSFFKEVLPKKRDISDFFKSIKFYLGRIRNQPKYSVFNFAEKFEFWALIWGTAVMVFTGIILWFPKAIPADWPVWVLPVARLIHYLEAILATLAILIWHLFQVMFHPDEYPLNTSWITGHITQEEAEHRFEEKAIRKMQYDKTDQE